MKEKNTPFISVIMNCYNSQTYLKEAIESVFSQTMDNWELIFWDNQSTDQSPQIVRSFEDPRIHYYLAPSHTSLGEARNLAAQKARGEWICFLDCDDVWLPEKLEKQCKLISEGNEKLGLIYSRVLIKGGPFSGSECVALFKDKPLPEGEILEEYLLTDNFIPLVSALMRKSAFEAVGGIPVSYRQSEDFYIFAAIAAQYSVRAEQSVTCFYRMHDNNISKSQQQLACEESILIIEKFWPYVKNPQEKIQVKNKLVRSYKVLSALYMLRSKQNIILGLARVSKHPAVTLKMLYNYFVKKDRNLVVNV